MKNTKKIAPKTVESISKLKNEPEWMLTYRLQALEYFNQMDLPSFGVNLSEIDFSELSYYTEAEVTKGSKKILDKEHKKIAGSLTQCNSEVFFKNLETEWKKQGVIFLDTDSALKKCPELFKKYFGTVISSNENVFSALNSTLWSGGNFLYVPKGVHINMPLHAFYRISKSCIGQFERTLIIADEESSVHCIEGCAASIDTSYSLHAAIVEIIVKKGASVRYTAIQNWSKNIYNLINMRMSVDEDGIGQWVSGNIGAKSTMAYPSLILKGHRAKGEITSLSLADENQHHDTGGRIFHLAPDTTSVINAKSVCLNGGKSSYRGKVKIEKEAKNCKAFINCDALLLDGISSSNTYPINISENNTSSLCHEASVSKIDKDKLFYLMSRGINEQSARSLIVNGFIGPITKELPLEYAKDINKIINLKLADSKI